MKTAFIKNSDLTSMLGKIAQDSPLIAPVKRGKKSFAFEWISDVAEVVFDYNRTILPPKRAIFPEWQTFLKFSKDEPAEQVSDNEPFVLFGVHPFDLAGIAMLDWAFSQNTEDPHYLTRRNAATIIGIDYSADKWHFCPSVGTADFRDGADLFLTKADGGYVVEVLTEKGQALLEKNAQTDAATDEQVKSAKAASKSNAESCGCKIDAPAEEVAAVLERRYESKIWEQTSDRCYSCGTCTIVCPTCFCFDVKDEMNLPLTAGERKRRWDSCQYLDFALVAGDHNFRGKRASRVRHRWLRKFDYLNNKVGKPFCTGCSQACTAKIWLVDTLNELIAEDKQAQ